MEQKSTKAFVYLVVVQVAQSGPGLTFVVYPEGLAQMPGAQFWCVLFFVTMFIVGMGTLLGMFEAVLTAIEDEFPICRQVSRPPITAF